MFKTNEHNVKWKSNVLHLVASFACQDFLMYNIIRVWISYFQVFPQAILKLFAFEWISMGIGGGGGGGTWFSCKLCWYSMDHICWLNGFKSSRVQGIKWASNHHAAADTTRFGFSQYSGETCCIYCIFSSSTVVWGSFHTLDHWWLKTI